MCGFAGFIERGNQHPLPSRKAILQEMGARMAARGPDEEACVLNADLSLVFRRLSIVDLETGTQPIWNEDHTCCVVANGEIYNHLELRQALRQPHQFRTRSDSEIILHLWEERGTECVSLLNGIFAFAIWNSRDQSLFLARDRFGVKPLFYAITPGSFIFGSEIKALLVHPSSPRTLNFASTEAIEESPVLGIQSLPGGHFAVVSDGALTTTRYWSIQQSSSDEGLSADDYVERYADLVEDAVRQQLMSDVPLAVSLSGGLDSSIIAAIAGRMNGNILAFTIYEEKDKVGDRQAARELANLLGMRHHEIAWNTQMMLSASASLIDLEYLVWAMDSPFGTLQYWSKMLACRAAQSIVPGLKVILIGQGSDEFSGGYTCGNEWQHANADWDTFMRRVSSAGLPAGMKTLATLMPGGFVSDQEYVYASQLQRRHTYLQKIILWCEDRAISSQGLECRVPFLDHRIVELLLSIPAPLRRTLLWDKEIVRRAAQRWLPAHLARRPKCGFIPMPDSSFEAAAGNLCRMFPAFEEKYLWRQDALFDGKAVRQIVARLEERVSRDDFQQLFRSMQFAIFNEQCQRPTSFDYLMRYSPLD